MGAIWIGEADLGRSLPPSGVTRPARPGDVFARVLVRLHGEVLGSVGIPLAGQTITAEVLAAAARTQLDVPLTRHLEADGGSKICRRRQTCSNGAPITVVVCTRDRPGALSRCLKLLQQVDYTPFDVIVVDNAPSTDAARECFECAVGDDVRFRYAREPAPGLSAARNRGLGLATAPYVAFTDDDVQVDPGWLQGIAAGFTGDERIGCVTGLVFPAILDTPSQQYFERRFGWGARTEPHLYRLEDRSPVLPYSAGTYGTGANFAVDRRLMESLGGFDEALGAGSPAGGGEELDAFLRILRAGRWLAYAPSAVVWHTHRAHPRELRRQLFAYGSGLTAFLSKYVFDRATAADILSRIPQGARQVLRAWRPVVAGGQGSLALVVTELLGMVVGPVAYLRGRRR